MSLVLWFKHVERDRLHLTNSENDRSDIETNHLSGWDLEFLVHTSLQVLIEERLQFFVLLIQQAGLLNKILALNEHLVVLAECLV